MAAYQRPRTAGKTKIESLQVIRAIAFLAVFIFHAVRAVPGKGEVYDFLTTGLGPWAVSVFFVLSGFLMTYSYWDKAPERTLSGMASFALNKIKKLFPLHIVMLVVGTLYLILRRKSIAEIISRLVLAIPLLQTWSPVGYKAINSVAWYLSVCAFLYFMFPCILPFIKKGSLRQTAVKILAVYALQILIGYIAYRLPGLDKKWITYCHPVYRLGDFVIGGLMASIFVKKRDDLSASRMSCSALEIIAIAANLLVWVFYMRVSDQASWFAHTCLLIPTSSLLVYAFSLDGGVVSGMLKNRVVFWVAAISPYAFLIHRLVIHYLHYFVVDVLHFEQGNYVAAVLMPFAATIAAVYAYQAAEKLVTGRGRWSALHGRA